MILYYEYLNREGNTVQFNMIFKDLYIDFLK